jgi:hypothetical protein
MAVIGLRPLVDTEILYADGRGTDIEETILRPDA